MKRFLSALLASASILGMGAAQAADDALTISYVRSPFNLQMMVMKEHGILEKHMAPLKLSVQWPEITSGAKQAQALASGDLDIAGVMNTASILMANGESNPVRIIAGVSRPTDVFALVGAKGGVSSVRELKGKTIAGPKGTVLHQLLVAALAKEGMTLQDVNFVQMDIPPAFSALQSGNIDAALLAANFVLNAESEGARVIARATGNVEPVLAMTTSEKFLRDHPDRVRAAVAAHDEAWAWIQANPAEAIALGARLQGITPQQAQALYDWSHFTQRLAPRDLKSLEQDMQFMLDNGMMRNRIDVSTIVDAGAMGAQ